MKKIVCWFILFFCCKLSYGQETNCNMKIYYIPFDAETYIAVTTDNIKSQASYKMQVSSLQEISYISQVISCNPTNKNFFEFERVRLLIVKNMKDNIFVDSYGNVFSKEKQSKISKKKLNDLNLYLLHLSKIPGS